MLARVAVNIKSVSILPCHHQARFSVETEFSLSRHDEELMSTHKPLSQKDAAYESGDDEYTLQFNIDVEANERTALVVSGV